MYYKRNPLLWRLHLVVLMMFYVFHMYYKRNPQNTWLGGPNQRWAGSRRQPVPIIWPVYQHTTNPFAANVDVMQCNGLQYNAQFTNTQPTHSQTNVSSMQCHHLYNIYTILSYIVQWKNRALWNTTNPFYHFVPLIQCNVWVGVHRITDTPFCH